MIPLQELGQPGSTKPGLIIDKQPSANNAVRVESQGLKKQHQVPSLQGKQTAQNQQLKNIYQNPGVLPFEGPGTAY